MEGTRRISPGRWLFFGLLAAGVLGLCVVIARGQADRAAASQTARETAGGVYRADEPSDVLPATLLPGLVLLTPEQLAKIPEVDGFQSPCGAPNGAMTYDAQPFGSPNPKRGGMHTGQDLNGIGGENTDLGEPVVASARGLVVYSGEASPGWGKVVVLAHRLPGENRVIQTLYAHLDQCLAQTGELVGRGARIGAIGTAGGLYLAHLHFEAIESRCTEACQRGYGPLGTMNRLDPAKLLAEHPAPAWADPYESLRRQTLARSVGQEATEPAAPLPDGAIRVNPSQFLQP